MCFTFEGFAERSIIIFFKNQNCLCRSVHFFRPFQAWNNGRTHTGTFSKWRTDWRFQSIWFKEQTVLADTSRIPSKNTASRSEKTGSKNYFNSCLQNRSFQKSHFIFAWKAWPRKTGLDYICKSVCRTKLSSAFALRILGVLDGETKNSLHWWNHRILCKKIWLECSAPSWNSGLWASGESTLRATEKMK